MEKDQELEQLFREFNPEFGDGGRFMRQLSRRLDAVEYVRQVHDRQIRRYRYAVIAAFVLGVACSSVVFGWLWTLPDAAPLFSLEVEWRWLQFIVRNSRLLSMMLMALLVSYGVISIIALVMEVCQWPFSRSSSLQKKPASTHHLFE